MSTDEPLKPSDASQVAAGGCIISIPIILALSIKYALGLSESKRLSMAHQVEEVEIETKSGAQATLISPEESLSRLLVSLRRITTPFEKTGARFEKNVHESEKRKLDGIKKRLAESASEAPPKVKGMVTEAEQLLARFAPED